MKEPLLIFHILLTNTMLASLVSQPPEPVCDEKYVEASEKTFGEDGQHDCHSYAEGNTKDKLPCRPEF